jgi:hypothetical protein
MGVDPESTALVKATAHGTAAGTVEGFMGTVGSPISEYGKWWGDYVLLRRMKTTEKVVKSAMQMCERLGLPLETIDLKVLVPWLQNVGLEEDPEEAIDADAAEAMHDRWAALLANAAIGDAGAKVMPSFPRILTELQPQEASMLEWLAGHRAGSNLETFKEQAGYDMTAHAEGQEVYDVYVDNLERLRLIEVVRQDRQLLESLRQVVGRLNDIPNDVSRRSFRSGFSSSSIRAPFPSGPVVHMTPLGRAFVAACTPPGHPDSEDHDAER